jgi:microcin C transport system substrate-binding protein
LPRLVFDTLMKSRRRRGHLASYGLLAEGVSYPDDFSSATFRLRAEAKWADGSPVTPEDVIFSFDKSKELNPLPSNYYHHVVKAEKTGERDVTFPSTRRTTRSCRTFSASFRSCPSTGGKAQDATGKPRDISRRRWSPSWAPALTRSCRSMRAATIRYELRDDYWGKDLNVNVGQNNFGTITYTYSATGPSSSRLPRRQC